MKFCLIFSVICVFAARAASDEEYIWCYYEGGSEHTKYECTLSINNPNGIEFDEIDGHHLPHRGDKDVEIVNAFSGTSKTIPSIICNKFSNLFYLSVLSIDVKEVSSSVFANCHNLIDLTLSFNKITTIPSNLFINNPKLEFLDLSGNKISDFDENSFNGSFINFVILNFNEFTYFDQNWLTSVNSTLRHLELMHNHITELRDNAFGGLRELRDLFLNSNPLSSGIAPTAFTDLSSLDLLSLTRTGIASINPSWFEPLSSLTSLYAQHNELTKLVNGTFNSLVNLQQLYLSDNLIRNITFDAFGAGLKNLHLFDISYNVVNNIDQEWIENAENIDFLMMHTGLKSKFSGNGGICIDNFVRQPSIECSYEDQYGNYKCDLKNHNPNGFNEFLEIPGNHLQNRSDVDVNLVQVEYANIQIIPSILCQKFENLRIFFISGSKVEFVHEDHFRYCRNLEEFSIYNAWMTTIPDFTFRNSPKLRKMYFFESELTSVSENAFAGTQAEFISLMLNYFTSFDQKPFEVVNSTLKNLDLYGNKITEVGSGGFSNLRNLEELDIGANRGIHLIPESFYNLINLKLLKINRCLLPSLHSDMFKDLHSLTKLDLDANVIEEFPVEIFNSMTNLKEIRFYNNQISTLSAESFGASLPSLEVILGRGNRISAVDPYIFHETPNLKWLLLSNNNCTQDDFIDVQDNLEEFAEQLSECFGNFVNEENK